MHLWWHGISLHCNFYCRLFVDKFPECIFEINRFPGQLRWTVINKKGEWYTLLFLMTESEKIHITFRKRLTLPYTYFICTELFRLKWSNPRRNQSSPFSSLIFPSSCTHERKDATNFSFVRFFHQGKLTATSSPAVTEWRRDFSSSAISSSQRKLISSSFQIRIRPNT